VRLLSRGERGMKVASQEKSYALGREEGGESWKVVRPLGSRERAEEKVK